MQNIRKLAQLMTKARFNFIIVRYFEMIMRYIFDNVVWLAIHDVTFHALFCGNLDMFR